MRHIQGSAHYCGKRIGVFVEVTHSRTGRSSVQVSTALPELCNHNTNNNSAVHATRRIVWPLAQTAGTAQCQNWQDHRHRKLNRPDFFPVGDASEGVDPTE